MNFFTAGMRTFSWTRNLRNIRTLQGQLYPSRDKNTGIGKEIQFNMGVMTFVIIKLMQITKLINLYTWEQINRWK